MSELNNNGSEASGNQDNNNNLQYLLTGYLPFWPVIIVAVILGLFVAQTFLRYQTDFYEVSTSILLKDDSHSPDNLLKQVAFGQNATFIEDEMEVIKGLKVMSATVKSINAQAEVLRVGRINRQLDPISTAPFELIILKPDSIIPCSVEFTQENGRLFIDGKITPFDRTINLKGNYLVFRNKDKNQMKSYTVKRDVKDSNAQNDNVGKQFLVLNTLKSAVSKLALGIKLVKDKKTSIIKVTATVSNVDYGKKILTALVECYQLETQNEKRKKAKYTVDFIDGRLMYVGNDLDSVEGSLENYKKENNIDRLSKEAELFLDKVKDGDKRYSEIEIQIMVLDDLDRYVKSKINKVGMAPSLIGLQDQNINEYFNKLNEAEAKQAALIEQNGPENDMVQMGANQIKLLKSTLQELVKNARNNLSLLKNNAENNYKQYAGEYDDLMSSIPSKERKLFSITRQQNLKNSLYIFLLQKREEAAIQMAGTLSDIRIIENTGSGKHLRPKRQLIYMGFAFGFAGIVIVLLVVQRLLNNKIMSKKEIESITKIPIIGELEYVENDSPLILKDGSRTLISEQLRAMRTNLSFFRNAESKGAYKISFSSSFPSEGKSFVASNIAVGYSLINKRVVLIEGDMRKPNISRHFHVSRKLGLSTYLSGNCEVDNICFEVPEFPGLTIIPAGPVPPNPVELLVNGRFELLLDELSKSFDYILIDCPPIGLVTDALEISKYVDSTMFIIRHGFSHRNALRDIINRVVVDEKKFKNVGLVYNAVMGGIAGYGYGYNYGYSAYGYGYGGGYGYGYGYGYGDGNDAGYYVSNRIGGSKLLGKFKNIVVAPFLILMGFRKK